MQPVFNVSVPSNYRGRRLSCQLKVTEIVADAVEKMTFPFAIALNNYHAFGVRPMLINSSRGRIYPHVALYPSTVRTVEFNRLRLWRLGEYLLKLFLQVALVAFNGDDIVIPLQGELLHRFFGQCRASNVTVTPLSSSVSRRL